MQRNNYSEATKKKFLQKNIFASDFFFGSWLQAETRRLPAGSFSFCSFRLCGRRSSPLLFDLRPDRSRNRKRRPHSHGGEASASPLRSGESRARRPRSISAPASY